MKEQTWQGTLTEVEGFEVGHAEDLEALTGVTVVLCRSGAVGALSLRGGAVGGRQLSPLDPQHLVDRVHGVMLAGGSAFGLAAADGALLALEREGVGFDVSGTLVPILPSAVIFDLKVGDGKVRPGPAMGEAAVAAASRAPVAQGCRGAGAGASIGKLLGVPCATKGGLGSAGARFADGLAIGALAVVNAFGDVRDPASGRILAGARRGPGSRRFADTWAMVTRGRFPGEDDEDGEDGGQEGDCGGQDGDGGGQDCDGGGQDCDGGERAAGVAVGGASGSPENTTLGVVVTNARLTALEAQWAARLAGDAFARVLWPGGTRYDGDLVFLLSCGEIQADPHRVGLLGREALEESMLRAVRLAEPLGGLPSASELEGLQIG
ncbi:MAG: P1 family peptidase [Polyangia bacterium]|jgi:L-aminopeptidase/D-esterase-like protein|nr:P1 family peptidase [Polyangia bacterium]